MNRLQFEKSPYLLQHQSNPVDWYPWGPEALEKSIAEDKPMLVSIGYSSCHWCHVMESESFSDPTVAQFMNQNFVNIKIDREERPDLDKIYMDAIVALSGSGGWPLNCFLLPDKRPFYGGTYFPPSPLHQKPSWSQILQFILTIFKDKRAEVEEQAGRLTAYVSNSGKTLFQISSTSSLNASGSEEIGTQLFDHLKSRFDRVWGGFGGAPKFPALMTHKLLLDYYFYSGRQEALRHVTHSLAVMAKAGIYDQLAGGFARYATDKEWNIPHFEKMLYDNAQFLSLYSHAYKLVPSPIFKKVVYGTASWLIKDMKSLVGGYFSALDADSEHEEGKYYVWTFQEIQSVLDQDEFELFTMVFAISEEGNWEDHFHPSDIPKNILWVHPTLKDDDLWCASELATILDKLLLHRAKRIPPLLDTKIITAWNALLCIGWLDAFETFGDQDFLEEAKSMLLYLDQKAFEKDHYKHQLESEIPPMLDDLAYGISAFLSAYRVTDEIRYIHKALEIQTYVMTYYFDIDSNQFRYAQTGSDLIAPITDLYDSTMPSAVGMMACNMAQLGRMMHDLDMESHGNSIIDSLAGAIVKYPESLSHWASLLLNKANGWLEIKGKGDDFKGVSPIYLPSWIRGAQDDGESGISFCHKFSCEMPVNSISEFRVLLDKYYFTHEYS